MRNSHFPADHPVLSKTADYALRAILVLARHGVDRPLSAEVIASLTGTPPNYLSKTLHTLARSGLLRSSRGPSGGFALAVDPGTLSLASIAEVFAEPMAAPRCLLGTGLCDPSRPCSAHDQWKRIVSAAREPLRITTIADLLAGSVVSDTSHHSDITTMSGVAGIL